MTTPPRNVMQRILDHLLLTRYSVSAWLGQYVPVDEPPADNSSVRILSVRMDRKGVTGSYWVLLVLFIIIFTTPVAAALIYDDFSYFDNWIGAERLTQVTSHSVDWLAAKAMMMLVISTAVLTWVIFATISGACYCVGWVISRVDFHGDKGIVQAMKGLRAVDYPIISVVTVSRQAVVTAPVGVALALLSLGDTGASISTSSV